MASERPLSQWQEDLAAAHNRIAELEARLACQDGHAAEALRKSEEHYRLLFERNPDGIFVIDPTGHFLLANPACERISGYPLAELLQKTFMELCAPDQVARTVEYFERRLSDRLFSHLETAIIRKDGQRAVLWLTGGPILADGKLVAVHCAAKDITERKQVEEALRDSRDRLQLILEAGAMGTFEIDMVTGVERWNDVEFQLLGLRPGEAPPSLDTFLHFVHPDDRAALQAKWKSKTQTGSYDAEFRIIRADGQERWLAGKGRFVHEDRVDPSGSWQMRQFMGVNVDITERKRAEQAAVQRAAELQALLDAAPIAIWIAHDPACRQITGNAYADRLFRAPRRANISASAPAGGAAVSYVVLRNGVELAPEQLPAQVAAGTGQPVMDEELELVFADGRIVHLIESAVPLLDDRGQVRGAVIAGADITERKQAEGALRESEERLRLATVAGGFGTYDHNFLSGQYDWSPHFKALHGLTAHQPLTLDADQVPTALHPDDRDRFLAAMATADDPGGSGLFQLEYRIIHPDGTTCWLHAYGQTVFSGEGGERRPTRAVGIVRDITDRKQREQQLKELNETLERQVAERTAVAEDRAAQLRMLAQELSRAEQRERQRISYLLHEHFQQLLVGAKFNLGTVQAQDPNSQESLRRADQALSEAVEASRSLAVELSPPILRYGGLGPALGWLGQWMQKHHGLRVEVMAGPHMPLPSEDVQALLFQAVRELLFNVVKHASVNQAKVELQQEPGQLLRLSVSDEGVGFDTDQLLAKGCPTGRLGLFSIQERLKFLGSRVEIRSKPGEGTCISLWVPLLPASQAP